MNILIDLFLTFARIGVCTFGGGYAMLPILQRELVENKKWATETELADYYAVRWGFPPRKVLRLAAYAFGGQYSRETLLKWLKSFYRRFFSQQFKRSCLPDGPKVGSVALSPRGDWRMPSDVVANLWLDELEGLE